MRSSFSRWSPSIKFLGRYRDLVAVALIALVPAVWLAAGGRGAEAYHLPARVVLGGLAPLQWAVRAVDGGVRQVARRYVALMGVQRDNEVLRRDQARLEAQVAAGEEVALENHRLRDLLGLQARAGPLATASAEIIAVSPSPLFRSIRIGRGRRHGLHPGAAVMTHAGVVGRVAGLGDYFADVMMLVDGASSVDVVVQRTRARARVRGTGGDGSMDFATQYLARAAEVEPGDLLVTSGLGGTFPRGLSVGTVTTIRRPAFGLYQEAEVRPSVDFRRLEEVLVVLGPPAAVDAALAADDHRAGDAARTGMACEEG